MRLFAIAVTVAWLAVTGPADAVLVYRGPAEGDRYAPIVAARNDGSDARVIARGFAPRVSPRGHRVAYIRPEYGGDKLFVVGNRGRHRRMVASPVYDVGPFLPLAWSHDGRYLIAARAPTGAWLVDVWHGTKTHIRVNTDLTGASFDPGGSTLAVAGTSENNDGILTAIHLTSLERQRIGDGFAPLWGGHGLAFTGDDGLMLQKHLDEKPETLLRRTAIPFGWSADGNRLLAYETSPLAREAVRIDLSPRRIKRLPRIFPSQLSGDGTEVLGQLGGNPGSANGNVVVRKPGGAFEVLATNATSPSWTK